MDPIANMLTSIRNAQAAKKELVCVPYSKMKMEIAKILVKEKFLKGAEHKGKKARKSLEMTLLYNDSGQAVIEKLSRISRQSQRIYVESSKIRPIRRGFGLRIISTSLGLLTDKESREKKVGGEVICEVW